MRRMTVVVLAALGATLACSSQCVAANPPSAPLTSRAARISRLLARWAVRETPPSSAFAPCPVAPLSGETARIAPTYTYPKDPHSEAEVDLTIARWRTAALSRSVTARTGNPAEIRCIGLHQRAQYKRVYHKTVVLKFTPTIPTWVTPNPAQRLHGFTETIRVSGYPTPLIYVEIVFLDAKDPRTSWSIGFFDSGQPSFVPTFKRILAAAEQYVI